MKHKFKKLHELHELHELIHQRNTIVLLITTVCIHWHTGLESFLLSMLMTAYAYLLSVPQQTWREHQTMEDRQPYSWNLQSGVIVANMSGHMSEHMDKG